MPESERSDPRPPPPPTAVAVPQALALCPVCRGGFALDAFDAHLLAAHRLVFYKGKTRPVARAIDRLLGGLVREAPDPEAWRLLTLIAREDQGSRADAFLASGLAERLARIEPERTPEVVEALGALLGDGVAATLVGHLAADAELGNRHLALVLMGRRPPPFEPALAQTLRGLLVDRRVPVDAQCDALASYVRSAGVEDPLAQELILTLASGQGKGRAIERLNALEQRVGKTPLLDSLRANLEEQLRMTCPRCNAELRRPEMIEHLWTRHQLLLDGRRVRDPWGLIEEWADALKVVRDPELADRCRLLGQRLDPEDGVNRVNRLLLSRGAIDPEARRALAEEAEAAHASLCPSCHALVPVPRESPPLGLTHRRGRLAGGGYVVSVSERGWLTSLELRTARRAFAPCREPGRLLTPRGALQLLVGPFVWLALALSLLPSAYLSLPLVASVLLIAAAVYGAVRVTWRHAVPAYDRVVNYAWAVMAPRLHAGGFDATDAAFLAGLAAHTPAGEYSAARADSLIDLLERTEDAVSAGKASPGHLAALWRLAVDDKTSAGADPVPLVADVLSRCFEGHLPLAFAERLLAGWQPAWLTPGNRARLRILLCDRAFEAGFEVRNLLDAGQTAPALGAVLAIENVHGLAALRLLWSQRPTRPWDRCGPVELVYELAEDADRALLLARYPDLLLWQEEPDWPKVAADDGKREMVEILFAARGVVVQGVVFPARPAVVEINARWADLNVRQELVVGEHRFLSRGGLDELSARLEQWFRFAFGDFGPLIETVPSWQSPDRAAILRAWGAVPCPSCRRSLLPHVGEVGLALEEPSRQA